MIVPYVFMSYARSDAQGDLARKFHRELCVEIHALSDIPVDEAGYIDVDTPIGDSWPTALANALGDCRIFLPLVSTNYFRSVHCGKEWQAFWNRLTKYEDEHDVWPALIVPVVWSPPEGEWPDRTLEIQRIQGQLGEAYESHGMRYLVRTPDEKLYQEALVKLATTVVAAGREHRLPQDPISPLSLTENFFAPGEPLRRALDRHEYGFVAAYLKRVRANHERLMFGDPTSIAYSGQVESAQHGRMRLSDVFIMPSVEGRPQAGASGSPPAARSQSAQAALESDEHSHVVVLGPPGTGKTTLVHYLVHSLAEEAAGDIRSESEIPIHVRLAQVQRRGGEHGYVLTLLSGVQEIDRRPDGSERDQELVRYLVDKVEHGDAVLFLDGLDEVPTDLLEPVSRAIKEVVFRHPECRVVVTCREYDYANLPESQRFPFRDLTLLPFGSDLIYTYVERWYEAYTRLQPMGNAHEMKRLLKERIREGADLQDLATTPILLTLITLMSVTPGTLPSRRSSLYYQMVRQLLAERPAWRTPDSASPSTVEEILPIAALVANRLQNRVLHDHPQAAKGFTMDELRAIIETHVGLRPDSPPHEYNEAHTKVSAYLRRITQTNGLIVDQGNGILRFAHRSLQEFLAGMHFLNGAYYEVGLECADQDTWREPMLLMAGHGASEGQSLFYLVKFMTDLTNMPSGEPGQKLLRSVIVAEMLAEIGPRILTAQSYGRVLARTGGGAPETGLWYRVVDELYRAVVEPNGLNGSLRVRVLFALGDLGDRRFLGENGAVRWPEPARMVSLRSGTFRVGTESPDVVNESPLDVRPVRDVRLAQCFIGRHPVVNVEYAAFIDDDGYDNDEYWDTEEARLWLHGDQAFIDGLYRASRRTFERDFQPELADRRLSEPYLLNNLRDMAASRREPFFWRNHRLNRPNQPVVGVNWWEARAYCRWLNVRFAAEGVDDGIEFRLPTEHEWERATRPDREPRDYPWGDDPPDSSRAHYRDGGLRMQRAVPVGAFPEGTWDGGPHDLAGNVWEWTASKALAPGAEKDGERNEPLGMTDRVIRGGSWYSLTPTAMRTSFRGVDRLQNVYVDLGFRIAATYSVEPNGP